MTLRLEGAVLVVDDEPMVRMLVRETLEDHGYEVIETGDGQSAIGILESDRPISLLVTDVSLPGLNGRELAETAKRLRPDLKILFMTGYTHEIALSSGTELITKPFSLDNLAHTDQGIMAV
jgi:CheY-like chemotaxis protein